jgi:hypothetical protein
MHCLEALILQLPTSSALHMAMEEANLSRVLSIALVQDFVQNVIQVSGVAARS